MKLFSLKSIYSVGLAVSALALLTGCEEANMAVDTILGRRSPVLSAAPQVPPSVIPAAKRVPGEKASPTTDAPTAVDTAPSGKVAPPAGPAPGQAAPSDRPSGPRGQAVAPGSSQPPPPPQVAQMSDAIGKKSVPGALSPQTRQTMPASEERGTKETFVAPRDPFKQPTEILPSECPPSMPLCRFDRSQLKLVGVIQVSEGQFKGLVEDPDGRGYFITSGMQIGGATVTQVTNKGITLHVHRTRQDVTMPLFREARESGEF
jgi:hypothetical protein